MRKNIITRPVSAIHIKIRIIHSLTWINNLIIITARDLVVRKDSYFCECLFMYICMYMCICSTFDFSLFYSFTLSQQKCSIPLDPCSPAELPHPFVLNEISFVATMWDAGSLKNPVPPLVPAIRRLVAFDARTTPMCSWRSSLWLISG